MNKFLGLLSLSMKAGKLAIGEGRAEDAVRGGKASLIILSTDASGNTQKKFSDMGSYRNIPVIRTVDRRTLGRTIGREFAVVMAVTEDGFSKRLLEMFDNADN